jgi:hypothetical protein
VSLLHLNPQIVVESTQLPQPFHRDPADQMLVATARVLQCSIMTEDSKIEAYPARPHCLTLALVNGDYSWQTPFPKTKRCRLVAVLRV